MESNWKKGDTAICVRVGALPGQAPGNSPALRLNAEYNVNAVEVCGCGDIALDVGLPLGDDSKGTNCTCGARTSPKTGIWWCSSTRFVRKQSKEEVEKQLEEAVAQENYELAQELSEKLKA
jgi:hypothetical protein